MKVALNMMRLFVLLFLLSIPKACIAGETILAFGDSVTACTRPPYGSCPVPENETYRARVAAALSAIVINGAVSGDNTEEALPKLSPLLDAHKPDLVIIMFGLNDEFEGVSPERYKQNLSTFIRNCRRKRATVLLMTPNPTRDAARNQRLKPYVQVVRDTATEFRVRMVDNYQAWCEWNSEGLTTSAMTYDDIHPNSLGHEKLANRVVEALSRKR